MNTLTIERIRIMALVSFVILGAVAGVILFKINESSYEVRQAFADKLEQKRELNIEIERMQESIKKYHKEISDVEPFLFDDRDVPAFLDSISQFAAGTQVTVIDMKTRQFQQVVLPREINESMSPLRKSRYGYMGQEEKELTPEEIITFAAMPIQIKIRGAFESLVDFLFELDQYQQLITLSDVEIKLTKDYPVLECNFLLKIYSLKTLEDLESI